jgi:hypothetical protein
MLTITEIKVENFVVTSLFDCRMSWIDFKFCLFDLGPVKMMQADANKV